MCGSRFWYFFAFAVAGDSLWIPGEDWSDDLLLFFHFATNIYLDFSTSLNVHSNSSQLLFTFTTHRPKSYSLLEPKNSRLNNVDEQSKLVLFLSSGTPPPSKAWLLSVIYFHLQVDDVLWRIHDTMEVSEFLPMSLFDIICKLSTHKPVFSGFTRAFISSSSCHLLAQLFTLDISFVCILSFS